ncbi:MAG: alpha-2-macroglobulin family protein [Bacteriovoracia bacterium]
MLYFLRAFVFLFILTTATAFSAEKSFNLTGQPGVVRTSEDVVVELRGQAKEIHYSALAVKDPISFFKRNNCAALLMTPQVDGTSNGELSPMLYSQLSKLPQKFEMPELRVDNRRGSVLRYSFPEISGNAGVYLVEALIPSEPQAANASRKEIVSKSGTKSVYTTIVVSDLGIKGYVFDDEMAVMVVDRQRNSTISGANVAIVNKKTGELVDTLITDQSGFVRFKNPNNNKEGSKESNLEDFIVVAQNGDHFALAEIGSAQLAKRGPKRVIFGYTDRTLYRPGNKVGFKGILRDLNGRDFVTVAGRDVRVVVTLPNGDKQTFDLKTSKVGTVSGSFDLPSKDGQGNCWAEIQFKQADGTYSRGEHLFVVSVEDYQKPAFQIATNTTDFRGLDRKQFLPNEPISYHLNVKNFGGTPVRSGKVQYHIEKYIVGGANSDVDWVHGRTFAGRLSDNEKTAEINENGQVEISFNPPERTEKEKGAIVEYVLVASIYDEAQNRIEAEVSAKQVPGAVQVQLAVDENFVRSKEKATVRVSTVDFEGKAVSAEVTLRVKTSRGEITTKVLKTSDKEGTVGQLNLGWLLPGHGEVTIEASCKDMHGNETFAKKSLYVIEQGISERIFANNPSYSSRMSGLTIVSKRANKLKVGDIAQYLVLLDQDFFPASMPLNTLPTVIQVVVGQGKSLKTIPMYVRNGVGFLDIPITKDEAPGVDIGFSLLHDGLVYSSSVFLNVLDPSKKLEVLVSARPIDQANLDGLTEEEKQQSVRVAPGGKVRIDVNAYIRSSNHLESEASVVVVDKAYLALQPEGVQNIYDFFHAGKSSPGREFLSIGFDPLERMSTLGGGGGPIAFAAAGNSRGMARPQSLHLEAMMMSDDVSGAEAETKSRVDFRDSVFNMAADLSYGRGSFDVTIPDSLTDWVATAMVVDEDTNAGQGSVEFSTYSPFTVQLSAPQSLTQGDEIILSAVVRNNTKREQSAKVSLRVEGGEILGEEVQARVIAGEASAVVTWNVRIADPKKVKFTTRTQTATGGDEEVLERPVVPYGVSLKRHSVVAISPQQNLLGLVMEMTGDETDVKIKVAHSVLARLLGSLHADKDLAKNVDSVGVHSLAYQIAPLIYALSSINIQSGDLTSAQLAVYSASKDLLERALKKLSDKEIVGQVKEIADLARALIYLGSYYQEAGQTEMLVTVKGIQERALASLKDALSRDKQGNKKFELSSMNRALILRLLVEMGSVSQEEIIAYLGTLGETQRYEKAQVLLALKALGMDGSQQVVGDLLGDLIPQGKIGDEPIYVFQGDGESGWLVNDLLILALLREANSESLVRRLMVPLLVRSGASEEGQYALTEYLKKYPEASIRVPKSFVVKAGPHALIEKQPEIQTQETKLSEAQLEQAQQAGELFVGLGAQGSLYAEVETSFLRTEGIQPVSKGVAVTRRYYRLVEGGEKLNLVELEEKNGAYTAHQGEKIVSVLSVSAGDSVPSLSIEEHFASGLRSEPQEMGLARRLSDQLNGDVAAPNYSATRIDGKMIFRVGSVAFSKKAKQRVYHIPYILEAKDLGTFKVMPAVAEGQDIPTINAWTGIDTLVIVPKTK